MNFRGLFVGIDSYGPDLTRLRFARRDAVVLDAIFQDNLGGDTTLLVDGDATKERFVAEIRHLAEVAAAEDFVVITFSGHGLPGGALALSDVSAKDPDPGSLPLDELVRLVGHIRAKALVLVLDCCFAGNAAERTVNAPGAGCTSRDGSASISGRLDVLRRKEYAVIAAADHDQEAREEPRFRHGLLSHYLIEGLLGRAGTTENGRVHILQLAHYVFTSVSAYGQGVPGRNQDPVLVGSISNFSLPVFIGGPRYLETADGKQLGNVTSDIATLASYGIPGPVLEMWKRRIGKLNQLQRDAVNEGALLEGVNVLVSAPTSTGKTMVGEISALRSVAQGKKAVFLLPTRALVNEQYERFQGDYGPLGIDVIRATGELRNHLRKLISGDFDIAVLTYEKFVGLLSRIPGLLNAGVLVIDEIHSLALAERGPLLETLLTWLRMRKGRSATPQIVGLSAALGNPAELARWLGASHVPGGRRSVPLLEGVLWADGRYRHRGRDGEESIEELLEPEAAPGFGTAEFSGTERLMVRLTGKLVAWGQQVIVFRSTRGGARGLAQELARTLGLPPAVGLLASLDGGDSGRTTDLLRACLEHGVAFHLADLTLEERSALEKSFRSPHSEVRVLVATTTLAQGVNLPADSVIIGDLTHPSAAGLPYSVAEYKNMAGRAGRTGMGRREGRAVIVARGSAAAEEKWRRYVLGEPEPVRSVLFDSGADIRAVILAGLAEPVAFAPGRSGSDVDCFLEATFAAHQSRSSGLSGPFRDADVRRRIDELVDGGFLKRTVTGSQAAPCRLVLTDLGRLTVRSGLGVDSVTAVVEALGAVAADRIGAATLVCAAQLMAELADSRFQQLPQSAYAERKRLMAALRARGAAEQVLARLMGSPSRDGVDFGRARRSIACLMWAEGIALANIERAIADGAMATRREVPGPVQHAVQRTADVIDTVIEIAHHVHPTADLGSLPDVLPHQLDLGIAAGLVPVARHAEPQFRRSVYIALARKGLTSPADILAADPQLLLECGGGGPAQPQALREAAAAAWEAEAESSRADRFLPPVG